MPENILFVLPETQEEALWALPVLAQYLETRLVTGKPIEDLHYGITYPPREATGKIAVVSKFVEWHDVIRALWKGIEVLERLTEEVRDRSDIVFVFDPKRAYSLTCSVEKHIVESYGILIGALPFVSLPPILPRFDMEEELGSVLWVQRNNEDEHRDDWLLWEELPRFYEMGKEAGISVSGLSSIVSFRYMVEKISQASVVVGVRGTGTLLAACFQKIVMELTPDNREHRKWMLKNECPFYRTIYGDLRDMTAEFVWDRTKGLVEAASRSGGKQWVRQSHTRSTEGELIQTEQ